MKKVILGLLTATLIGGITGSIVGVSAYLLSHRGTAGENNNRLVLGASYPPSAPGQPISALNGFAFVTTPPSGQVTISIEGTWSGTLSFQVSYDGGNTWFAEFVYPLNTDGGTYTTTYGTLATQTAITSSTTTNGTWSADCKGAPLLQVIATSWVSGTANVYLNTTNQSDQLNYNLVLLPSGARTSTTTSPVMFNRRHRGIVVYLTISNVVSGTVGLYVNLFGISPTSDTNTFSLVSGIGSGAKALTAGRYVYVFYPGAAAATAASPFVANIMLPATFQIQINHGVDTGTYTYSVGASLLQ